MSHEQISSYQRLIGCSIHELAEEALCVAKTASSDATISCRVKNAETLAKKIALKKASSVLEINDVYALRVLVPSVKESYAVLNVIMRSFPSFLDHDYIANPKTRHDKPHLRGKSLRLIKVVAYRNNVPFEVQITTFEFNDGNELLHGEYHREKYS